MTKKKEPVGPLHYLFRQSEKYNYYRKRFYSDSNKFSFFDLLTPVTIEKIEKALSDLFPVAKYPRNSLERYLAVLGSVKVILRTKFTNVLTPATA